MSREQFMADLDDWLTRRGDNLVASARMILKCQQGLFQYWCTWLRQQRIADGLPPHVPMTDAPSVA